MAWVVDTCILIDVAIDDPVFGRASAYCLQSRLRHGLLICPVTYVEIGPLFDGEIAEQDHFLEQAGIEFLEPWTSEDTKLARQMWARFIVKRRQARAPRRPVADVLIGAFASRFQGLITRNPGDFRSLCPKLKVIQPR